MAILRTINMTVRFLLELCLLAALGYWGFSLDGDWPLRLLVGIGAPLLAAVVWGLLVSPKAKRRLADPWRFVCELVLFVWGAAALVMVERPSLAVILLVVYLINRLLVVLWGEDVAAAWSGG
ncbi:MAG: YrdB family protein [Anaerolineae bacterium]|nr:YrdB family protein [Anaerolineae bacterium]